MKQIYKLNKIKENLEASITKRDEVKSYSQTLLMFIDFILHLIKVRHDDILRRQCNVAVFKYKREQIIKTNEEISEERQKIIEEAKANNPNVRIPKEGDLNINLQEKQEEEKEEIKEEEKKEEEKEEEKKEEQNNQSQGANEEQKEGELDEEKKNEADSIKLAEQLMKFDEEHVKQPVPDDIEYDIDNDYDIEQNEKDTIINAALQAASNPQPSFDKKK